MEEWMFFLERYNAILARAAVLLMGLIAIWLLARILRQIKRLNKSLRNISENIQAYVDVVLSEEEETEEAPTKIPEIGEIDNISDENMEILRELEGNKGKKELDEKALKAQKKKEKAEKKAQKKSQKKN